MVLSLYVNQSRKAAARLLGMFFGHYVYLLGIKDVACVVLSVLGGYLQFVSATHELNPVSFQLPFQPTPVVTRFRVVLLVVDGTHDVGRRVLWLASLTSQRMDF